MLKRMREEALRRGYRLVSHPKVTKLIADPRLLGALGQGYALKGKLRADIEGALLGVAEKLRLATKGDIEQLEHTVDRMARDVRQLEQRLSRQGTADKATGRKKRPTSGPA